MYTQKMHEVQKFFTLSDHGVIEYAVVVNKKFWEGLPPDIRAALDGAMKEATKYANDIAKQENDDALAKIKASGKTQILTLTPDEKKAWKKAVLKVHQENEDKIGKDLIREIYMETGFDPAKL
jgi:C4-dicarboxylate-binding protein DctP